MTTETMFPQALRAGPMRRLTPANDRRAEVVMFGCVGAITAIYPLVIVVVGWLR